MRDIILYRHNLFRISEPFITQQAQRLERYRPLYLGRLRYGPPPAGATALTLQDLHPRHPLPFIAAQMLTRSPAPYQRLLQHKAPPGFNPALIHAHFGIEGVYALPLAERLGIPLVTTFHGFDATLSTLGLLSSPAWMQYPIFRHQLAARGALFLCASAFLRERVLALGFPAERTRVHYIGVDCSLIQPRPAAEEGTGILHIARLVEVKGTEYLLRAVAALPARHKHTPLTIIGDGPLRKRLESLAASLGIAEQVRFLGARPHPEVVAELRRAAMLVLPSVRTRSGRVEGLGMVMLEAAASGVPVIGSRIGGIPEAIIEGETGLLAPPGDAEGLAAQIATLLDNTSLRQNMGQAARRLMEQRFDLAQQTALLEQHYDALLAEHAPRHARSEKPRGS